MEIFNRILGLVAVIMEKLGRQSINFIPLNFVLMLGALLGSTAAGGIAGTLYENIQRGEVEPRKLKLTELLDYEKNDIKIDEPVIVEGSFVPTYGMQYGRQKKTSPEMDVTDAWAPLVDWRGRRGMFVRLSDKNENLEARAANREFTGWLDHIDTELRDELNTVNGKIEGIAMNTSVQFHEGKPMSYEASWNGFLILVPLSAGLGIAGLLSLIAMWRRYIIFGRKSFEPGSAALSAPTTDDLPNVKLSAFFKLNDHGKVFHNVPVAWGFSEEGELVFLSNIDASSKFMGFTTSNRAGVWSLVIPTNEIEWVQYGRHYWGGGAKPALRIKGQGVTPSVMIFKDENDLQKAVGFLRASGGPAFTKVG